MPHDAPAGQFASEHHDHASAASEHHAAMLMVQVEPAEPQAGQPAVLHMMVHDSTGKMVAAFETVHEKKAHLIIVRQGLDQFAHIHPEVDEEGNLTADFQFPVGGEYHLFLDHKPAGKEEGVATAVVHVAGDTPEAPTLTPNVPGNVSADDTVAMISAANVKPGEEATVEFHLSDGSGKPVNDLEPYLGAMGHLVIISANAKEYVHAHPTDADSATGEVNFMAHFAKAGLYKGWGQFQRAGKVRTIPFVIDVK